MMISMIHLRLPIINNTICSIMLGVWRNNRTSLFFPLTSDCSDGVMGGHGWFEVGAGSAADADPVLSKQMTWTLCSTFAIGYGRSGQFVQT